MSGKLSGKILNDIATKKQKSINQISLKWLIQKGIRVIPLSRKETHLKENLDALNFELNEDEMNSINELDKEERTVSTIDTELKLSIAYLYQKALSLFSA